MKKRILSFTLLFVLICSTQVYAFSDVPQDSWYYESVTQLQEKGLISGYADNSFKPQANISNAEALKMILSAANIQVGKSVENAHWAQNYLDSAIKLGLVDSENIDLDQAITRNEVAKLAVNTLNLSNTNVNTNSFKDTTDKNTNILYKLGIIKGNLTEDGLYFYPSASITRAEMSVILLRIAEYEDNSLLTNEETSQEITLQGGVKNSEINYSDSPMSVVELQKVLLYMASKCMLTLEVKYPETNVNTLDTSYKGNVSAAFNNLFSLYPEYFSFTNKLSYMIKGSSTSSVVTFNLSNPNFSNATIENMEDTFAEDATEVVEDLVEEDKITADMTDKEKAKVLYDWIILHTEYDKSYGNESFNGYGQIVNQKAVCQGYASTFNYMCKLIGLDVYGISGTAGSTSSNSEKHIWTVAILDGQKVHIDATWGDAGSEPNYDYFCASSKFMRQTHKWDSDQFGI